MNGRVHVEMEKSRRPQRKATPRRLYNRLFGMAAGSVGTSNARGPDGLHSIHFAFTARGFASTKGRRWREGEAERAALYGVREDALEGGEAGWWSNIAEDRNELAAFFRILEALERHDRANANVYTSEVIALPAELTARQRRRVVRRLCKSLDRRGLPYSAGIHLPDPTGDQRNYHVHIISSLRPATRTGNYEWSFSTSKESDINTPTGILARRQEIVAIINRTLRAAGITKRYTALSNKARNMDAPAPKRGQEATWLLRRLAHEEDRLQRVHSLHMQVGAMRNGIERGVASMFDVRAKMRVQLDHALARLQQTRAHSGKMLEEFDRIIREREAERLRRRDYLWAALARMREAQDADQLAAVRHGFQHELAARDADLDEKADSASAALADARLLTLTALQAAAARLGTENALPSFSVLRAQRRTRLQQIGAKLAADEETLAPAIVSAAVRVRIQNVLARLEASSRSVTARLAALEKLRGGSGAHQPVQGHAPDDKVRSRVEVAPLPAISEAAELQPVGSASVAPAAQPRQDLASQPKRLPTGGLLAQAAALRRGATSNDPRKPDGQAAARDKAGSKEPSFDKVPPSGIDEERDAMLARDEAARRARPSRE